MNITGLAMDWVEAVSDAVDDPEARPAGFAEPHYSVSEQVTLSRDNGLYVYHLPDDQLGQGSSLGNARVWAETKGNGDMLRLFSIEAGATLLGGMSVTYLLPFSDLSAYGMPQWKQAREGRTLTRAMPSAIGTIHLHPAYQQREFVIGDGVHILETFFVPRTGMDDPAVACGAVSVKNRTHHPIALTVVASLDLRGFTPIDIRADYDRHRQAVVGWNESNRDWVRVFGSPDGVERHWATTDQEEAYNPNRPFPNTVDETGNLTGALQFDLLVYPGLRKKIRLIAAFSPKGRKAAMEAYDSAAKDGDLLKKTISHYHDILTRAVVEMPDEILTPGIQWAKACLLRPISRYQIGDCVTNDPGNSTHIVGRDTAWYTHGCDLVDPEWACSMLEAFARSQHDDGLIVEYIDGKTGKTEDNGLNINDDTPLFILAVYHHLKATGHQHCMRQLYEPAVRAGEKILKERNEQGLVCCTADGLGARAICGWRNVLQNDQITGVVTEVNSECHAALGALGDMAEMNGDTDNAERYRQEAHKLRELVNRHLRNADNGLYNLNIDLKDRSYSQATCDLVFPLIFGVADQETAHVITTRLSEADFMTDAGIRVLPSENPRYDPSFESGCMGGVWPGVTWWYAMGASRSNPSIMADSLRRAYLHYVANPKSYNTVPGQFSEWSDGQTLVNRGMRLSPWDSPRFLWAAIEGLAGVRMEKDGLCLNPKIPEDWLWLRVNNVRYRDSQISFFLTRQHDGLHAYVSYPVSGDLVIHPYQDEISGGMETITTGISTSVFRSGQEILACLGSNLDAPALGPFLAHHALKLGEDYKILSLTSRDTDWRDLGVMDGHSLQRIVVRVEAKGYALYRFLPRS